MVLHRLVLAVAMIFLAASPHFDAPGHMALDHAAPHADAALADVTTGHSSDTCGPTLACNPAVDLAPDTWRLLDRSGQRVTVEQTHAADLAHPSPDSPVPISQG